MQMKKPYEVMISDKFKLIIELHNRPVDFEIVFMDGSGTVEFSREQDTTGTKKGKVDKSPGSPKLKDKKHVPGTSAPKKFRIEETDDASMYVEYSDPDMG